MAALTKGSVRASFFLNKRFRILYAILLGITALFLIITSLVSLATTGFFSSAILNASRTYLLTFINRTNGSRSDVTTRVDSAPLGEYSALQREVITSSIQVNDRFRLIRNCTRRETGVEDILCMHRPDFLPQFRNPCWYQDGKLRCLPYFHIIGVCKTGTSDLFRRLVNHPHVLKNSGVLNKELWYWTWLRYGDTHFHKQIVPKRLLEQFIDSFDAAGIEHIKINDTRFVDGVFYPGVTGHGDPMDFWDQTSWKMIPQNDPDFLLPEVTTPSLIKHVNPDVKLILVLRDPIERLFSHYLHGQFGTSAAQFHNDVISTLKTIQSCNRTLALKACLYSKDLMKELKVPISASFYSVHLSEWLRVFPRNQMLIIRTEDFSKDVPSTLINMFRFLNLDPLPSDQLYRIAMMPHFYYTKAKKYAGKILPETVQLLQDVFQPYNRELAAMLNDTNFLWAS